MIIMCWRISLLFDSDSTTEAVAAALSETNAAASALTEATSSPGAAAALKPVVEGIAAVSSSFLY